MADHSAGLVVFRRSPSGVEVLLVHPGGPFWQGKDEHAWSVPKGEFDPDEEPSLDAALREFAEELGSPAPDGPHRSLGTIRAGRKLVHLWLCEGDLDVDAVVSNTFEMEWPPRSGRAAVFPEIDRAAWFDLETAPAKLHKGQAEVVSVVRAALDG